MQIGNKGLMAQILMLIIFAASLKSLAYSPGGYCAGTGFMGPGLPPSYAYQAGCSWTDVRIRETKLVFFQASDEVRKALKGKVDSKLQQLGVTPLAQLKHFTVYSNVPRAEGEKFCLVKPTRFETNKDNILNCEEGIALSTNALQKEDEHQILLNNGFKKVIDIQNVPEFSSILYTATLYSKKY